MLVDASLFRMSVRPRRLCQKRSLKSIFQREMLWGRGRGRRDVPALLWKGKRYHPEAYAVVLKDRMLLGGGEDGLFVPGSNGSVARKG